MKKNSTLIAIFLIVGFLLAWGIFQRLTPIKDGAYLRYETTRRGIDEKTSHEFTFTKTKNSKFLVDVKSTGLLEGTMSCEVDRYFKDQNMATLHGPIGAVIWISPSSLRIGKVVAAGEVIKETTWEGYDVYVIQDLFLPNCYGYYDKKTGLQVGYYNCWSVEKLTTVLKESSIKIKQDKF